MFFQEAKQYRIAKQERNTYEGDFIREEFFAQYNQARTMIAEFKENHPVKYEQIES